MSDVDLVQVIKKHALDNYDQCGLDFVVECWDDNHILDVVRHCKTPQQAIAQVLRITKILDEQRRAAVNEVF